MAKSRPERSIEITETTRAVDDGGTVKRGEVHDETGRLLYWARRPFGYGGEDLDRGQIVGFQNLVNDEQLIRLGYVLSLLPKDVPLACRYCAATFIDENTRTAHGAKRHQDKERRPEVPYSARGATVDDTAAEVQRLERELRQLDEIAPLNLDKTAASRGA